MHICPAGHSLVSVQSCVAPAGHDVFSQSWFRAAPPASPIGSLQQTWAVAHCRELVHEVTVPAQEAVVSTQANDSVGGPPASGAAVVVQQD
jgi:hypothetical protein